MSWGLRLSHKCLPVDETAGSATLRATADLRPLVCIHSEHRGARRIRANQPPAAQRCRAGPPRGEFKPVCVPFPQLAGFDLVGRSLEPSASGEPQRALPRA